jgi:hypothetical protein
MYGRGLSKAGRPVGRRATAVVCAAAVGLLGCLVVEPGITEPAAATVVAGGDESASQRAVSAGERVEVMEKRTDTSQTFANPDGTFTLEQSNVPVRTKRNDEWLELDPTLRTDGDGRVRPRATALEMSFSGGGSDPLIALKSEGHEMKLTWPNSLPEPTVDDDSVTYANVFPDVDLKITATPISYSEVLVVKTPQAARLPELQGLELGVEAPNLTVQKVDGGAIVAKDDFGKAVFTGAQPVMWDSRGEAKAPTDEDRTEAPLEGDKVVPILVEVDQDSLSIAPSPALVNDAAAEYPLHIDPPLTGVQMGRAMINQAFPSTASWLWSGPEGVGYQSFEPWSRKRLMFKMAIPGLAGTHVVSAVFSAFSTWAASCTKKEVQLWKTANFGSGVNWNVGSGSNVWLKRLGSATDAVGRDECTPNGKLIEFSALTAVSEQASANSGYVYLGLRAADESDSMAWKRFRSDVRLAIIYNNRPQVSGRRTIGPSMGCSTVKEQPIVVNTAGPRPQVNIIDKDVQSSYAQFEFWKSGETQPRWRANSPALPAHVDTTFQPEVDAGNLDTNVLLAWRVRAFDGIDWSNWSTFCWYWVDTSRPAPPSIAVSGTDPHPPGVPIGVRFDPEPGTELVGFRYTIGNSEDPTSGLLPLSTPTFSFTPEKAGLIYLKAWSEDRAGNQSSSPEVLPINVGAGTRTAKWAMDEGSGTSLADGSPNGITMNLGPTVEWTTGDRWPDVDDRAIRMPGDATAATAAHDILDSANSFTVSIRVRPGPAATRQVAMSEDRPGTSSFLLGLDSQDLTDPEDPKATWSFSIPDPDGTGELTVQSAPIPYEPSGWTYLTGIYNAVRRTLTLWVNAEPAGELENVSPPASDGVGPLRLGFAIGNGVPSYFFDGDVDDARVYPVAVPESTILTDKNDSNQ